MDLSQGVPSGCFSRTIQRNQSGRETKRFTTPDCSCVGCDQEKKGEFRRGGHKVNLSCGSRTPLNSSSHPPPPPPTPATARRCVPSTAIQAKHGPLSTLARRVITLDWERAERRISLLCYFSRSGLQTQSSRQASSLHTVVTPQPVYSHTHRGTLSFDL